MPKGFGAGLPVRCTSAHDSAQKPVSSIVTCYHVVRAIALSERSHSPVECARLEIVWAKSPAGSKTKGLPFAILSPCGAAQLRAIRLTSGNSPADGTRRFLMEREARGPGKNAVGGTPQQPRRLLSFLGAHHSWRLCFGHAFGGRRRPASGLGQSWACGERVARTGGT